MKLISKLIGSAFVALVVAGLLFPGSAGAYTNLSIPNSSFSSLTLTGPITGSLTPSVDNTYDVGSTSLRWRSGYFGTSLAVPAISVTSTGAGITLYNTTDQMTNFEKGNAYWSSNVFTISTSRGGTGTNRDLKLYNEGWGSSDGMVFSAGGGGICFFCITRSSGNANTAITRITGTNTASSNTNEALQLDPTINQSGTAGYNVLSIDPTITAEGSGGTKLLRLAVGGTDQFYIDKNGYTYVGGSYAGLTEGDGYYFGDSVRGLRYLSGDDFEFQNWHVGGQFYISSFNGTTRTRHAVFDAPTKRAAFSSSVDLRNYTPNTDLEVVGTASATRLMVSATSTIGYLSVGNGYDTMQQANLMIKHTPTQSEATQRLPFLALWNTSSTLGTPLVFLDDDAANYIASITAYGDTAPFNGNFGFAPANMVMFESTSGTIMTAGDAVAVLSASGAFRPITGLGFGNVESLDPFGASASTTITNGNMASASLDFPNSAAAGTQDLTITVNGAADGDECQLGVPNALASRASEAFTCFVSAANTVTVRRTCVAGAGCGDPGAATVKVGFFSRQ